MRRRDCPRRASLLLAAALRRLRGAVEGFDYRLRSAINWLETSPLRAHVNREAERLASEESRNAEDAAFMRCVEEVLDEHG